MTDSRFNFGIFLSFFFILLNLPLCAPLSSAFDSEKDLPFCEQQQCDQFAQEYPQNISAHSILPVWR